jgi:hypothetical protein
MRPSEAVQVLKGSSEQKHSLFNELMEKAVNGQIEEWEIPFLETLKKELIKPVSKIVDMSSSLRGGGGVRL